jgi:hypothetical protein
MTTTVQLTDRLPQIIESTWDDVVELLKTYFIEHDSSDDFPCLHNDLDYSGAVHELIDSAVPIYNAELRELAYFHHDAATSSLADKFGSDTSLDDWPMGPFAAGLYCLIEEGINEKWDEEAEDLWDSWMEELDSNEIRKLAIERVKQKELE